MRKTRFRFIIAFVLVVSVNTATMAQTKAFDTANMDTSVEACTDFFEYANGAWLKTHEIPASQSNYGSFSILQDSNRDILHSILDKASAKRSPAGSSLQLIGDHYYSCMNEAAIEKAGKTPLKPYLDAIDRIKDVKSLATQLAAFHNTAIPGIFAFGAAADLKNNSAVIANAGQGGLTLPNRDYYVKSDDKSKETRAKFVEYATNMFKLLGYYDESAATYAKTVLDIQTRLAEHSLSQIDLRDPNNSYNKIPVADAAKAMPNFPLRDYMAARGVPVVTEMNLAHPKFFKEVNEMMKDVSIENWKTYLRFMLVNAAAPSLSKAFVDANFNFFSAYLAGTKEQQPRWKRCVQSTDNVLGEALGEEYVKIAFTKKTRDRANEMIDDLFWAFNARLNRLTWMSEATKVKAREKLASFRRKIGSNDHPRGYKGLVITRTSFAGNVLRYNSFNAKRNLADIGKPRDLTRWGFTPPTVNASYNSVNNDITFPAGILQPPFFNWAADDAINYGGMGAVIGHEISHGFDDSGSRFGANGDLKMWWTADDRAKFEERAACVVKQFDGYEVQPGLFILGKLTLGENIGDLGGLNVAYEAFLHSLEGKPRPANIDNFTPEQRFFLGWAQVWAAKYTSAAERLQVNSNPHSLPRWRVNGPLANMQQFAQAFGCRQGQPMVRKDACIIW
ncbi:MAG TPA: M13 family metallopeptidase [Pyrinomonadaceae bacterium]|nr:M13 family metallopeptidase [Pyrinomonadaceae bacterium]